MANIYDIDENKRVGAIVLACSAAALAGIAAVSAVALWRASKRPVRTSDVDMRDIEDVLSDCYSKITEIERSVPEIPLRQSFSEPGFNGHVTHT